MNPNTPHDLKAMYRYQFEGPNIGISFARGWLPLFAQLCADIDRTLTGNKRGFHWVQVKEKFGSARFYFAFADRESDVVIDIAGPGGVLTKQIATKARTRSNAGKEFERIAGEIRRLVNEAESKTRHACLACGAEGSSHEHDDYYLVLCPVHQKARVEGQLPALWFPPAD